MTLFWRGLWAGALSALGIATAWLPGHALAATPATVSPNATATLPKPLEFVTRHHAMIRGRTIAYTAIAGETYLHDLEGKPTASIFSFTYLRETPVDRSRPVSFIFNGGPGASSLSLHVGALGPRRVNLGRDTNPSVVPPFRLEDNSDSILDVTDLVFIDPVGTGYSHALGDTKPSSFYSVDGDAASVAQFIEQWLTAHGRWNSPKYIVGESYGSVRAAVMPRALMGGPNYMGVMRAITLNGIVLLGTTMDARDGDARSPDLVAALALPSMADTAWYHHRIDRAGRSLAAFDDEVTKFAAGDYFIALARASAGLLSKEETAAMAARVSRYTGVPAEYYATHNLRMDPWDFGREALADQGLDVGMYDGRYTLPHAYSAGDSVADDPAMAQYEPAFTAAFHDLLRDELKVDMPVPYGGIVWVNIAGEWDWSRTGVPKGQNFAADLVTGMRRNPTLHLLVASGYYDLVTHAAAAEQAFHQAGAPANRTSFRKYESGHMLYLGGTATAFSGDIRAMIAASH